MGAGYPHNMCSSRYFLRILEKLKPLEAEGIREVLESLYRKYLSLRKVAEELRERGIRIRPKDLVIVFECLNIPREKCGHRSALLRALGGTDRAREILQELYRRLGSVAAVYKVLKGDYIPENVKEIVEKYNLKPIKCSYITVYYIMRRTGLISPISGKFLRIIFLLGGREKAKKIIKKLYSEVKILENGSIRYPNLRDIAKKLQEIIGDKVKVTSNDIREIMKELGIARRQPAQQVPLKPFRGSRPEMFYIWGLCFGDARLQLYLNSVRVDARGTLPTILCFYEAFKEYIPETSKPPYRRIKGNEYEFSHSFDHKSFSFLLWSPEKAFEEVRSREDLVALLAGLIDSEGSINFQIREREYLWKGEKKISLTFDSFIEITNCDLEMLRGLRSLLARFGIKSSIPPSRTGFGCWRLRICRRKILLEIIPLLLKYVKHKEKRMRLKELYGIIKQLSSMRREERKEFLRRLLRKS